MGCLARRGSWLIRGRRLRFDIGEKGAEIELLAQTWTSARVAFLKYGDDVMTYDDGFLHACCFSWECICCLLRVLLLFIDGKAPALR